MCVCVWGGGGQGGCCPLLRHLFCAIYEPVTKGAPA